MLSGNNEELTRDWWRAEHNLLTCAEYRKNPESARYLDNIRCDCKPNSLAKTTFSSLCRNPDLMQDPTVTVHNGIAAEP